MIYPTEFRIFVNRKLTKLEKGINSFIAGDIKNLTIKEDRIMLEELKLKRDEACVKLAELDNTDIEVIVNEKLNEQRETITAEVVAKLDADKKYLNTKIEVLNDLISEEAAKELLDESTDELTIDEVVSEDNNVSTEEFPVVEDNNVEG